MPRKPRAAVKPGTGPSLRPLDPVVSRNVYALAASLLVNVFSLAIPLLLMQVFDRLIAFQAQSTLLWLVIGCLSAILFETVARLAREAIMKRYAAEEEQGRDRAMATAMLAGDERALAGKDLAWFAERYAASAALRNFDSGSSLVALVDSPFALLYIVMVWYLAPSVVLAPFAATALYAFLVLVASGEFSLSRGRLQKAEDERGSFVLAALGRIHAVKAGGMENTLSRRFDRIENARATADLSSGLLGQLPSALGAFFSQAATFGVIVLGAGKVMEGTLTVGAITACSMLAARAFAPVQSLMDSWLRYPEIARAKAKVGDILGIPPAVSPGAPTLPRDIEGFLELRSVSLRALAEAPAELDEVDLSVHPRRSAGIVCTDGVDASCLLEICAGARRPDSGTVLVDGLDLSLLDRSDTTGRLAFVGRDCGIFRGTVLENIILFDESRTEAALDAAALVELERLVVHLPRGFETQIDPESAALLPFGLASRIGIARAMTFRPRVLAIDRPDASLDRESGDLVFELLSRLRGRCTILVSGTAERIAPICDDLYRYSGGKLAPMAAAPGPAAKAGKRQAGA